MSSKVVTQKSVKELYQERGYISDLKILALGLSEECGEVCAAVLDLSSDYKPKDSRVKSDLEHELKDALTYLYAIANASGINLTPDSEELEICGYCDNPITSCTCNEPVNLETFVDRQG